jgi:CheY-like chemotaxis protein
MSVVPEPEAPRPEPEHFALDAAPAAPALELSNREARTPALLDAQDVEPLPALPPDPSPSAPAAAPRTASPPRPLVRQAPPPAASVSAPSASPAHEPVAPLPAPSAAEPPPSPVADRAATNRAILAEDSLTARIFLTRLLEQQGLEVRAVSRASELLSALEHEHWELVCVDVELPDARGEGMLREALRRAALRGASTLVALVRDETDAEMAARAGFRLALRKPFDQNAVRSLLLRARLIRSRES